LLATRLALKDRRCSHSPASRCDARRKLQIREARSVAGAARREQERSWKRKQPAGEVLHSSERKHQRLLGQGNGGRGGPAGCGGHAGGGSGGAGGGRGASSVGFGRGGSGRTAVPVPVTPLATPVDRRWHLFISTWRSLGTRDGITVYLLIRWGASVGLLESAAVWRSGAYPIGGTVVHS